MLQAIRDKITGWFAGIFLGAIAVVFVFWGIQFESTTSQYAAKVEGERISLSDARRAWQQRQQQLQRMFRAELPEDLVKAQQTALLDDLVRRKLLQQRARELGYRVPDEVLAQKITDIPQFQVDGKFDKDRYAALLVGNGLTQTSFEEDFRRDLMIEQLQSGISESAFSTPRDLERRYVLERQERRVDYALIPAGQFAAQAQVTDEQIEAYYKEHQSDYLTTETVDFQYVELNRADAESKISVSEADLRAHYEQTKEKYQSPERRHARHVLITTGDGVDDAAAQKTAEQVLSQAKSGTDFAELAKKYSKDPGSAAQGGDLGWAQRGMFVGPFEDALFSMQAGEIRGPVKTEFGYHVIKLEEVEAPRTRTFDEVRAELETEYRQERAQSIFDEQVQKLEDTAFASLTELESVGKAMNLPIKTVAGFTRSGGGEFGNDPSVIEAAFSEDVLERGQNSPIVALGNDRAIVLRITNHKAAEPRPLAEVRSNIESQLRQQAAREAASKKGAELVERLNKGEAWTAVLSSAQLSPVGQRYITRQDSVAPAPVVRAAFETPRNQVSADKPVFGGVSTEDGNYVVFALSDIRNADPAAEEAQAKTARATDVARQLGEQQLNAYEREAERTADIDRNPNAFQ